MVEYNVTAFIVTTSHGEVAGILTDIDLVQSLTKVDDLHSLTVAEVTPPCEVMTEKGATNPCTQIYEMESIRNGLKVIEAAGTHTLLVAGSKEHGAGLVSIHSLLRAATRSSGQDRSPR